MELNYTIASLSLFQLFMWGITDFVLNYPIIIMHRDNNEGSTPRTQHVESLITHVITDKATYLSESS